MFYHFFGPENKNVKKTAQQKSTAKQRLQQNAKNDQTTVVKKRSKTVPSWRTPPPKKAEALQGSMHTAAAPGAFAGRAVERKSGGSGIRSSVSLEILPTHRERCGHLPRLPFDGLRGDEGLLGLIPPIHAQDRVRNKTGAASTSEGGGCSWHGRRSGMGG